MRSEFEKVKEQIEEGIVPIENGKITRIFRMSPELQEAMKKKVKKYERAKKKMLAQILARYGLK